MFYPASLQLTSVFSRLRYTNFSTWCDWHLPETQNASTLSKSKRLHACHSCRQAARICSKFPNKVIAAEISLNCSNGNNNLDPTAEFSVVCDDASDTTLCTVRPVHARNRRLLLLDTQFLSGHESFVCAQRRGPALRQARRFWRLLQLSCDRSQQHQQRAENRRDCARWHVVTQNICCVLIICWPGFQDQTPRIPLKFNITT